MAEGGWGSGTWGEAGWGMSVYYRDAAETAVASDSETAAGSVYNNAVSELAQGVDNVAPFHNFFSGVEDGAAITASAVVAPSTLEVAVGETSAVSDVNSAQQVFACTVEEMARPSHSQPDTFNAQQVFATSVSETAVGADALDANFAYYGSVGENVTAAEVASTQHVMPVSVGEGATVSELATAQHVMETAISEAAAVSSEDVVAGSLLYTYITETLGVVDQLTARFLWEPIDDNEDANWQNINDGQTPGWSAISDSQTPNWTEVQTA